MTHQYTKLADALELKGQSWMELNDRQEACREASSILRSAAAGDVAGLMAMSDTSIVLACDYLMTHKESAKAKAIEHRAALESALRLALAARDDDVFTALDMSPDTFRTEGGAVNVGKLRAAIRHPADCLPPDHWLAAAAPKGTT